MPGDRPGAVPARGLVLVCDAQPGGFGHAMAHRAAYALAAAGHEVDVRGLDEAPPTPSLTGGDTLVVVHPEWRRPPAEIDGWLDGALGATPGVGQVVALRHSDESVSPGELTAGLWARCAGGSPERVAQRRFAPVATSPAAVRAGWLEEVDALLGDLVAPSAQA